MMEKLLFLMLFKRHQNIYQPLNKKSLRILSIYNLHDYDLPGLI